MVVLWLWSGYAWQSPTETKWIKLFLKLATGLLSKL